VADGVVERSPAATPDPIATGGEASSDDDERLLERRLRGGVVLEYPGLLVCLARPGVVDLRGILPVLWTFGGDIPRANAR
jgi:hypothetical protein